VIYLSQNVDSSSVSHERRQPAEKVLIKDIDSSQKVNVIGVVVSTTPLIIDDGTGQVHVRTPEINMKIGDVIMTMGRVVSLNEQPYISADIVKKSDPGWLSLRKKELEKNPKGVKQKPEPIKEKHEDHSNNHHEDLLLLIKKLDKGEGVDIDELLSKSNMKDSQKLVDHFIQCGEVFEITPGKIKVLE